MAVVKINAIEAQGSSLLEFDVVQEVVAARPGA